METSSRMRDSVLTVAGIVIILFATQTAQSLVVPFLLSLFISIVITVPVGWLQKHGLSTLFSVGVVLAATLFFEMGVAALLGKSIAQFNQAMPEYQARLSTVITGFIRWLGTYDIDLSDSGISEALNPSLILNFANSFMSGLGNVLSNLLLIMFTVFFMLLESRHLPVKLQEIDKTNSGALLEKCTTILDSTKQYIALKTLTSLLTGVLITIGLSLIGLDFASLWGFLAFVLNFIPNIGSILAAAPAVLLACLQLAPIEIALVIGLYLLVNMVIGNVIEPTVMGQKVGLSTLAVFLSLIFWGWLLGPAGMLLSIPLTMVIKYTAQANDQTRWLAILLASPPATEEEEEK